jgi:hypothetical protein
MRLPTFIIAGVEKAGTTSSYNYLSQHPQIYVSPRKEVNFLERDWEQYYANGGVPNEKRIDTWEKYQALFTGVTDEIAIGEASINCLFHHDESIPIIQKYVPDIQVLLILRHPAERAYSDYLMHVRDCINGQTVRSLSEQIKYHANTSFTIRKGFYTDSLKHFIEAFGAHKVTVFLYDDLQQSAVTFMQTMYKVIGVDPDFEPDVTKRAQVAQVPKNKTINSLLRTQNPLRQAVSSGLKLFVPEAARQKVRNQLINMNSTDKSSDPFLDEDRQALINLYREDILKLQDLIQRDLSAWLV